MAYDSMKCFDLEFFYERISGYLNVYAPCSNLVIAKCSDLWTSDSEIVGLTRLRKFASSSLREFDVDIPPPPQVKTLATEKFSNIEPSLSKNIPSTHAYISLNKKILIKNILVMIQSNLKPLWQKNFNS